MGQVGFLEIDFRAVAGWANQGRRLYPRITTKQVTQFDRFSEIS